MGSAERDIYITLVPNANARVPYTCGDRFTAKVSLISHQGLNVDRLIVRFRGKAKTFITTGNGNNRHTRKCKVYLFDYSKTLVARTVSFGESRQSWEADFQFPSTVIPNSTQQGLHENSRFMSRPGHLLPPSWGLATGTRYQSISYYLEAELSNSSIFHKHKKAKLELPFSPPRRVEHPKPLPYLCSQSTTRQSRLLDPIKRDQPYGLRKRTKQFFSNSDPDPTATFTVTGSVPRAICVGDIINITLGFRHEKAQSTAPEPPDVFLTGFNARLTSFTEYRVIGRGLLGFTEYVRNHSEKIVILSCPMKPVLLFDGMSVNELLPNIRVGDNIKPTFRTFNINVSYVIKVSISVVCADKTYEIDIGKHPLVIYPAIWQQDGEEAREAVSRRPVSVLGPPGNGVAGPSAMKRRTSVETLPVYKEVDESGPTPYKSVEELGKTAAS